MPRLISVTILHRHGARGPGASELSPWHEDHPIRTQWDATDLENITPAGKEQAEKLGEWFAQRYAGSAEQKPVFWRCSKSERAEESGYDFMKGFNKVVLKQGAVVAPTKYSHDADNYFRPWKIFKEEAGRIKKSIHERACWQEKVNEEKHFISSVCDLLQVSPSVASNPFKALWSMTYFHAVRECEEQWPSSMGVRNAIRNVLDEETSTRITALALWVWEQRFLQSDYIMHMGGNMCLDILEHALDTAYGINIFSGHDYTVFGVLAVLGIMEKFTCAQSFCGYIIFELLEYETSNETSERKLRIILNPTPFKSAANVQCWEVQEHDCVVLAELSIKDIDSLILKLREGVAPFVLKPCKDVEKVSRTAPVDEDNDAC